MRRLVVTDIARPQPNAYFGAAEAGFLNWDTLLWRFAAERSYWLGTAGQDSDATNGTPGIPHSMPIWGIWHDCRFWFSTDPQSKKAQNLRQNSLATVHLGNTEAVFILECRAEEIVDQSELQDFVNEYNPKYKWNFTSEDVVGGVFALTPHKAFAWAGGEGDAFHNTATRFQLELIND